MSVKGGIADKAGNIYEAKWAVRQLLDVLRGEADAITFESIAATDQGFEFRIEKRARIEHHQAKRRNSEGNWTLRRLEQEGVLLAFKNKLATSSTNECVFISQCPAPDLDGLLEKARLAQSGPELEAACGTRAGGELNVLCRIWAVDIDTAHDWLRNIRARVLPEDEVDGLIQTYGKICFRESGSVYSILRTFLEKRMNRRLSTEDLRRELREERELSFNDWALDTTLDERLKRATDNYLGSYAPFGFSSEIIARTEAAEVLGILGNDLGKKVVILTGKAGGGKSGVVLQIIAGLQKRAIPCLAFRVDRMLESGGLDSPNDLGQALYHRNESPIVTLAGKYRSSPSVLLIDQVDAVSDISGRGQRLKDIVLAMIAETSRFHAIQIVLVCREFDFSNDERLKRLDNRHDAVKIVVSLLDWEQHVAPLLSKRGADPALFRSSENELLRLPLNLSIFCSLDRPSHFGSTSELLDRLVEQKQRKLPPENSFAIWSALSELALRMSRDQTLSCPVSVLDRFPRAGDLLASEGLIVRSGSKVSFFHEILFDHAYARGFEASGQNLVEFLKVSEQTLFRRTQVRQILAKYRQQDSSGSYLSQLKEILFAQDVRYHIREAVARWLGSIDDPNVGEARIVLALDVGGKPLPNLVFQAIASPGWFRRLASEVIFDNWLKSDNALRRAQAVWRLREAARVDPEEVDRILRRWWRNAPEYVTEVLGFFQHLNKPTAPCLVQLLDEIIRSAPLSLFGPPSDIGFLEGLLALRTTGHESVAGSTALRAWLDTWFSNSPTGNPLDDDACHGQGFYWVRELAKNEPAAFLAATLPAYGEIVRRAADGRIEVPYPHRHPFSRWHLTSHQEMSNFFDLILSAFENLARVHSSECRRLLEQVDYSAHYSGLHLWLAVIAANGQALWDLLPSLINRDDIFEAGWSGARFLGFAHAARAAMPFISRQDRETIETRVLTHFPELKRATEFLKSLATTPSEEKERRIASACHWLADSGEAQWAILKTIGTDRLSDRARRRYAELDRKFVGRSVREPDQSRGGWVAPPIPKERSQRMKDRQWLSAMARYIGDSIDFRTHRGGAAQLAAQLIEFTKGAPERFASLLQKLPHSTNLDYPRDILIGLSMSGVGPKELAPAIVFAHSWPERPFSREIAACFENHADLALEPSMLEVLLWYVEHGVTSATTDADAQRAVEESFDIDKLLSGRGNIRITSSHDGRGPATEALAPILWAHPELIDAVLPLIESRIQREPLRSVRISLSRAIDALLKYRPYDAARLTEMLANRDPDDLVTLLTDQGHRVMYYLFRQDEHDVALRLMERMLASETESTRLIGLLHLVREGFYDEVLGQRVDKLLSGDGPIRRIASSAAAHHVPVAEHVDRAKSILQTSFWDDDDKVKTEAADCFRHINSAEFGRYHDLARAFVESPAFGPRNWAFLNALKNATSDVTEFIISAGERSIEVTKNNPKGYESVTDWHSLMPLLRSAYEGCRKEPISLCRILDVIDQMLELSVYGAEGMVNAYDRS